MVPWELPLLIVPGSACAVTGVTGVRQTSGSSHSYDVTTCKYLGCLVIILTGQHTLGLIGLHKHSPFNNTVTVKLNIYLIACFHIFSPEPQVYFGSPLPFTESQSFKIGTTNVVIKSGLVIPGLWLRNCARWRLSMTLDGHRCCCSHRRVVRHMTLSYVGHLFSVLVIPVTILMLHKQK